jgi:hypothetical protein
MIYPLTSPIYLELVFVSGKTRDKIFGYDNFDDFFSFSSD